MSELTSAEKDKLSIELNKEFLVTRATVNGNISREMFRASVAYSRQAIRGLFLLHGASATAIIAYGDINKFKDMLIVLSFGVLSAVLTAVFSMINQKQMAVEFYDKAWVADLEYRKSIEILIKPELEQYFKQDDKAKYTHAKTTFFSYCSMFSCAISIVLFVVFICIFIAS